MFFQCLGRRTIELIIMAPSFGNMEVQYFDGIILTTRVRDK